MPERIPIIVNWTALQAAVMTIASGGAKKIVLNELDYDTPTTVYRTESCIRIDFHLTKENH